MKSVNIISAILITVMTGCGGNKQSESSAFIVVDVTRSYPKKELMLQDFMEVEYVSLETSKEFLCQGNVRAIGKDFIIVTNTNQINDGDIFIFDRNGKGLRKINRKGQGGEEYTFIIGIILDEDNDEIFVNDHYLKKFIVYDLYGNFKRSFPYTEGASYALHVFNYDREHLICYDNNLAWSALRDDAGNNQTTHTIISKQDGSIIREIKISFKNIKSPLMVRKEGEMTYSMSPGNDNPIIPYQGDWILTELSSDTVFRYLSDFSMSPFIVRTPSIQSMEPEVFLFPGILTERYYFMQTIKKIWNDFPRTDLVYDKQEKTIYKITVYNEEYYHKGPVGVVRKTVNDEIAFWQKIDADELVEFYEKGQVEGQLKEIAAQLEEESNPVIVLVKYRN